MTISRAQLLIGSAVTAGALAVGGIAYASTSSTPSSSGSASSSASRTAGRHPLAARALHGQLVVATKKHGDVTVDLQRGVVVDVTATSLEVRSTDGFMQTYVLTSATKYRSAGKATTSSAIADGDHVGVTATGTGPQTARLVRVLPAKASAGA